MTSNMPPSSTPASQSRLSTTTSSSTRKPLPHLPPELHLLIFSHLALLPRVHEPSPRWALRPPRPPEVLLISRASRAIAIREGGYELLEVCWRERVLPRKRTHMKGSVAAEAGNEMETGKYVSSGRIVKEVLKVWWGGDGRDCVYFGPLSIQHGVDMKIGLSLAPPRFYMGSSYSYTCSVLNLSLFGGSRRDGSRGLIVSDIRLKVRNVAVQKEIWEKLGSEKAGVRHRSRAISGFADWWPEIERDQTGAGKWRVVGGDTKWFAGRGEAQLVKVGSVGEVMEQDWAREGAECGWVVERDGYRGWEECKKDLEEKKADQSKSGETNVKNRVVREKTRYEWIGKGWLWGKGTSRNG